MITHEFDYLSILRFFMKIEHIITISPERLEDIESMCDSEIDTSDIPELDDLFWNEAILVKPQQFPRREQWLWSNPETFAYVQKGLEQAAQGAIHDMGSFAQDAEIEIDD